MELLAFDVRNRWTKEVAFTAQIDCADNAGHSAMLGLAVRWAHAANVDLNACDLRNCDLRDCDLRGSDLSGCDLSGCNLQSCDLRNCNLQDCDLRYGYLSDCDLSGCDLRDSNLSDCILPRCNLSGSNLSACGLRRCNLSGSNLSGCDLRNCHLGYSNLSRSNFTGSDLRGCDLGGSNLRGCNLSACHLSGCNGIPVVPDIHAAVYAAASAPDALDMGAWHTCGTTHCRAGWVTTLAGAEGRLLESYLGTAAAAALIYQASDPTLTAIPNFFTSRADARADMKRLAEPNLLPVS